MLSYSQAERGVLLSESRKLAAILAADVVGYSRLAGADEDRTLARLRALRSDLIDPTVAVHHGRVVKRTGDGALIEFRSVVDAVRCAIEVQSGMLERNAGVPAERRIEFRIGIHLGDVVEESDGDLMGDGVNIAARLEGIAKPGTICLSEDAYRQVKARLDLAVSDLGQTQLKNITEAVRVYSLQVGVTAEAKPVSQSQAGVPEMPSPRLALPDKPSIAVLPFTNMSGDPEQEYFSDGISEDIITDLSKIAGLMVISRNSCFTYKGRSVDVRSVGRDLGVRSVLEGSIRRAGNRVRITAQLIDAATGGHLWAERYDRDLTDLFAVQDDVTRRIVDALKVTLSPVETARLADSQACNIEAYDYFLRGREFLLGENKTREKFEQSKNFFLRALEFDPNHSQAYAGLSWAYIFDYFNRWSDKPDDSLQLAKHTAEQAIEKDPREPFARHSAALAFMIAKDLDRAKSEAEIAIALNPNDALAYNVLGGVHTYSGQHPEAIEMIERAIRLDPAWVQQYLHFLGTAYLLAGKYETAATLLRQRVRLVPGTDFTRAVLASALGHLGEVDEARRIWRELMEINPKYSFREHFSRQPFRPEDVERVAAGLGKAGLPN
jgi:adenylate cyclase